MLLLAAALLAVQRDLPRGQVIERVQAASDPAQTEAAVREMQQALREPADMAQRQEAAVRLKDLILKLRSQADAPRDSATRRVARRILGGFAVGLIDQGGALLGRKSYDAAARSLSIAAD
ncbi:MAG: hypothetical protein ACM3ZB_03205, partial [bacterium]